MWTHAGNEGRAVQIEYSGGPVKTLLDRAR
jgi:hypothetical protein